MTLQVEDFAPYSGKGQSLPLSLRELATWHPVGSREILRLSRLLRSRHHGNPRCWSIRPRAGAQCNRASGGHVCVHSARCEGPSSDSQAQVVQARGDARLSALVIAMGSYRPPSEDSSRGPGPSPYWIQCAIAAATTSCSTAGNRSLPQFNLSDPGMGEVTAL